MSIKLGIIALLLAVAALGVSAFATFTAINEDGAPLPPAVESQWSEAECEAARIETEGRGLLRYKCLRRDECGAYNDMLQAINDNCP